MRGAKAALPNVSKASVLQVSLWIPRVLETIPPLAPVGFIVVRFRFGTNTVNNYSSDLSDPQLRGAKAACQVVIVVVSSLHWCGWPFCYVSDTNIQLAKRIQSTSGGEVAREAIGPKDIPSIGNSFCNKYSQALHQWPLQATAGRRESRSQRRHHCNQPLSL